MITAAFTELLMKNMNVISKKSGFILFSLLLKLGFHSLARVYFWSEGFPNRRLAGILDVLAGFALKSAGISLDLAGLTMKLAGSQCAGAISGDCIISGISELAMIYLKIRIRKIIMEICKIFFRIRKIIMEIRKIP